MVTDRCLPGGAELVNGFVDTPVHDSPGSSPPEYACHTLDNLGAADRADISDGEDRGHSEFIQMYVLNLSGGVLRGRADLGDLTTGQCEEVSVSDDLCSLDSATDVVANVGSDTSDVPPFAKALVGDVKVDGSLVFDQLLNGVDHMEVVAGLAVEQSAGEAGPGPALERSPLRGNPSRLANRQIRSHDTAAGRGTGLARPIRQSSVSVV